MHRDDRKNRLSNSEKIATVVFSMVLAVAIVTRAMLNTRNERKNRERKS